MASKIETWARTERQYITSELRWLKVGGKVLSPSGDDVTADKISELEGRFEHVSQAIDSIPRA